MTVEMLKVIFAIIIVVIMGVFGGLIITRTVDEQTSFGLMPIITGLVAILGQMRVQLGGTSAPEEQK